MNAFSLSPITNTAIKCNPYGALTILILLENQEVVILST